MGERADFRVECLEAEVRPSITSRRQMLMTFSVSFSVEMTLSAAWETTTIILLVEWVAAWVAAWVAVWVAYLRGWLLL